MVTEEIVRSLAASGIVSRSDSCRVLIDMVVKEQYRNGNCFKAYNASEKMANLHIKW
jgi:hypothetical protein